MPATFRACSELELLHDAGIRDFTPALEVISFEHSHSGNFFAFASEVLVKLGLARHQHILRNVSVYADCLLLIDLNQGRLAAVFCPGLLCHHLSHLPSHNSIFLALQGQ